MKKEYNAKRVFHQCSCCIRLFSLGGLTMEEVKENIDNTIYVGEFFGAINDYTGKRLREYFNV